MPKHETTRPEGDEGRTLQAAIDLRDRGEIDHAIEILLDLVETTPERASVHGVLAGVYFEAESMALAAHHFKRASELSPGSELASRGLFHAYLELGQKEQAIQELRRFIAHRGSEEFEGLLEALTGSRTG